jgi:AraC-like DNA-binding protein
MAMLEVDRWLRERPPAPDLADQLHCAWHGDLGQARIPLPDECLDLVWVGDGTMWLSGPESRSWSRGYPRGTTAVGVRFQPGVGPAVLGLDAAELRDVRVRLEHLWGDRAARELTERVAARLNERGRELELEEAVRRLAAGARPVDRLAIAAAATVGRRRPVSVRDLARSLDLSERQVHRRFSAAFGYGPAMLSRMRRVRRVLGLARSAAGRGRMVDLAQAAGYSDQQHLTHEVRAVFGAPPAVLLRS